MRANAEPERAGALAPFVAHALNPAPRGADEPAVEIIASPWKRWGTHRTYLIGADETRFGFYDHQTGQLTVEVDAVRADLESWVAQITADGHTDSTHRVVVDAAASAHTAAPAAAATASQRSPRHVLVPATKVCPDPDLSLYQVPGALAVAKAATLPAEQAEPWLMGAAGEQAVAATLDGLPGTWLALHSIPLGDPDAPTGDLDHLVIGPGGVYVINAKHHPGQAIFVKGDMVMVARHSQPYIAAARRDAMSVAVRLSAAVGTPVTVTPVIAFVGADEVVIKFPPRDIMLTTRGQLLDVLTRRRPALDPPTTIAISDVAQRPETWR